MSLLLRRIAHSRIRPVTERLRLLLEAGLHELNVDVITCFLRHDHVFFASGLRASAPEPLQPAMEWWPFHAAGVFDPVPLHALTSVPHALQITKLEDGHRGPSDIYEQDPIKALFRFSCRECIECFYVKTVYSQAGKAVAKLFFNQRFRDWPEVAESGEASWKRLRSKLEVLCKSAAPRFDADKGSIDEFEQLVAELADQMHPSRDEDTQDAQHLYDGLTRECLVRVEQLRELVLGRLGDPEKTFDAIVRYFRWILDVSLRIIRDPQAVASCYCAALPETDWSSGRLSSRPCFTFPQYDHPDSSMVLMRIADAGVSEQMRQTLNMPFPYSRLYATVQHAVRLWRPPRGANRRPRWGRRTDDGVWVRSGDPGHIREKEQASINKLDSPKAKGCGLITLATHMAAPLYLADAQRRYCRTAPLYGPAYVPAHNKCFSALCVPLLAFDPNEEEAPLRAIGAVAIESSRPFGILPTHASYLSGLLQLTTARFPQQALQASRKVAIGTDATPEGPCSI